MRRRTLVIGDPHFREGCVREMDIFTEQCLNIVRERLSEIEFVVVLGDVMDRHGILHQKPFHQSCKFLLDLAALKKTYCLIGNHDFDIPSKYLPENHPYKVLVWNKIPNLIVVEKPMIEENMLLCPYVPPGEFSRAVIEALGQTPGSETPAWEALAERGIGMVFAHQEFLGCQMGRLKSETGDPWSLEKFGTHPFVVSGHIHDYQWVGENILYTGTPIQVNYGEGDKKGICLLDVQFADNGLPISHSESWIEIRMPKKIVKSLALEDLDVWVGRRFGQLLSRYSLPQPVDRRKKPKKAEKEGFETILGLHSKRESLGSLKERILEDRFLDRVRLQVLVTRDRQTTAKVIVGKLKDLPLGLQGIFTNESGTSSEFGSNSFSENNPEGKNERESRTWLRILEDRLFQDEPAKKLLTEVLKDLQQNG